MKIDKKTINSILGLPDDKLLQMINLLAGSMGMSSVSDKIKPETVVKIRAVLNQVTDADLDRAGELINIYKKAK